MIRKLAVLAALGLMLLPAFAEQTKNTAAIRAMNAGKEHLRRDEFGMAIKSFTKYASLEPEKSHPYDLRACTYLRMGDLDLASRDIAESQKIDSSEKTGYAAYWLKGVALLLQGDQPNAEVALAAGARGSEIFARRYARAQKNADAIWGEGEPVDKTSELFRRRLAELLLDEYVDLQLFGE